MKNFIDKFIATVIALIVTVIIVFVWNDDGTTTFPNVVHEDIDTNTVRDNCKDEIIPQQCWYYTYQWKSFDGT